MDDELAPPTLTQVNLGWQPNNKIQLGDCFAYALARDEDCPLLTLDRDFRRTDITIIVPSPQ